MKKVLSLVVALLAATTSFAQADAVSVSIIPRAGISLATMTNSTDAKMKVGFVGGADVQFQFNDILGLTAGAFYEMQGCKFPETAVTYSIKNDYINVPVLLNCYIVKGLQVKLGLQPGFLVSSKFTGKEGKDTGSLDTKDAFKKFDLAIPVGLSYEISNIILDVRYNWGLTNIYKKEAELASRNSVFQITLGYRFQL